jgi:hypothetical protein
MSDELDLPPDPEPPEVFRVFIHTRLEDGLSQPGVELRAGGRTFLELGNQMDLRPRSARQFDWKLIEQKLRHLVSKASFDYSPVKD